MLSAMSSLSLNTFRDVDSTTSLSSTFLYQYYYLISLLLVKAPMEIAQTLSLCSMPFFCGPCDMEERESYASELQGNSWDKTDL